MKNKSTATQLEKKAGTSDYILDKVLHFRYFIAIIVFILLVVFKIHGSSINMWDNYVSDYTKGSKSGLIIGTPRSVRSDEWLVQTPYSLSQTQTGFKTHNPVMTMDGQNMIVGYNSPAWNLATIGKPFSWGYLLLGKEYGLSWYWNLKLIGLILLAFEMGLILIKKNKYLAMLSGIWIPFSSALQWWFVSPVGDLVFFTLGFLVGLYYYFAEHENYLERTGFALITVIMSSGFILVLYPALQIPLGYLILLFLIAFFLEFRKKIRLDKMDGLIIGGALLLTGLIVGLSLYNSLDALKAVTNTAYPGKRISLGGDIPKRDIFFFLMNWKLPFQDVPYTNNSEISSFYHLFFIILPLSPFIFYRKIKENIYGFILFIYCIFNLLWMAFAYPEILAKLTLWSYVPAQRALLSFGFAATLLSIWFIGYIWQKKSLPFLVMISIATINLVVYYFSLHTGNLRFYVTRVEMIGILIVTTILIVALFKKWKLLFTITLLSIVLISGCFVNPIVQGVSAVYEKKIALKIKEIERCDPNQLWAGERLMYGYLPMLGVHTYNGVAFTPNFNAFKPLDPKSKKQFIYNRYAHINVEVGDQLPTLKLLQKDAFVARLSPKALKTYGIKYVVVYKRLENLSSKNIQFKRLYGPDSNGAYIYRIID